MALLAHFSKFRRLAVARLDLAGSVAALYQAVDVAWMEEAVARSQRSCRYRWHGTQETGALAPQGLLLAPSAAAGCLRAGVRQVGALSRGFGTQSRAGDLGILLLEF